MAQRSRSLGGRWFTFGAEEREKREDGGGHSVPAGGDASGRRRKEGERDSLQDEEVGLS